MNSVTKLVCMKTKFFVRLDQSEKLLLLKQLAHELKTNHLLSLDKPVETLDRIIILLKQNDRKQTKSRHSSSLLSINEETFF